MTREQKARSKARTGDEAREAPATDARNAELAESTDDVLDAIETALDEDLLADIDDVLEDNAQEFVDGFLQEGGE